MSEGRSLLVTGASRGIGAAIVKRCVEAGWRVFANVRNTANYDDLLTTIPESGHSLLIPLIYDVTDEQKVKEIFSEIQKQGGLQGLVNNAGIMLDSALAMTRLTDLQAQFETNAKAAFQHCQMASRLMTRVKQGSIVNVNSQVAMQGSSGQSAYAMSKAALSGLTKSIAKELGPLNIRVNEVCPGFIGTDLTQAYNEEQRLKITAQTSLRRLGQPEEVADVVYFLLSEQSRYVTGQSIAVDGQIGL